MHHPRSHSAIWSFRIAAFLLVGNYLLALIAVGILIHSFFFDNRQWIMVGASLAIVCLFLVIAQWISASRTFCPLCKTPVLAPKACTKHRRSKTFMGSHRLLVAMGILFKSSFRCPYCNEPTAMELRKTLSIAHARRHLQ